MKNLFPACAADANTVRKQCCARRLGPCAHLGTQVMNRRTGDNAGTLSNTRNLHRARELGLAVAARAARDTADERGAAPAAEAREHGGEEQEAARHSDGSRNDARVVLQARASHAQSPLRDPPHRPLRRTWTHSWSLSAASRQSRASGGRCRKP